MAEMYDNPTKETWRGWAWNQISTRIVPGSLVVTLCGKTAKDAEYGTKRGMRVIGVDLNQDGVDAYRQDGHIAVKDKLHRQVFCLNPDAVIFDMLGGLTTPSLGDPIQLSFLLKAAVWNGLRGRDMSIPSWLQNLKIPDYTSGRKKWKEVGIHRGMVAWVHWAGKLLDSANKPASDAYLSMIGEISRPCFQSYRSKDSGQYFDSCAWSMGDFQVKESVVMPNTKRCNVSKRKAAAAKALMTMKRSFN